MHHTFSRGTYVTVFLLCHVQEIVCLSACHYSTIVSFTNTSWSDILIARINDNVAFHFIYNLVKVLEIEIHILYSLLIL